MPYLLSEIAAYLVFAWLVGLIIGWALNRCNCQKEINKLQQQLEDTKNLATEKENTLARLSEQLNNTESELVSIQQQLSAQQARQTQTREALIRLNRKRDQLGQWATLFQNKYLEQKSATTHAIDEHAAAESKWLEQADGLRQQIDQLAQTLASKSKEVEQTQNKQTDWEKQQATIEEQWQARTDELHQQISSANQKLADQQQEIAELTSKNIALASKQAESGSERLYTDVEAPDNRFFRLVDQIRLLGTSKKDIIGRLQNENKELQTKHDLHTRELNQRCDQKDLVIQDLRSELRRAQNRLQQKAQDEVDRERISALESELKAYEQKIKNAQEVEAESAEQKLTIEAYRAKMANKEEEIALLRKGKSETKTGPNAENKKTVKKSAKANNQAPPKTQSKRSDDLKRIKGVGPKLEGLLHKQGITSFEQLASLSESDIEDLSNLLGNFQDRIVRDDWVGKARALHIEKYGDDPS